MLLLLRKIRRKLITRDHKVINYLLYAIGEIILVVAGILIAFSIDNWSERRLKLQKEIEILHAFDLQFEIDLLQFEEALSMHLDSENSIDIILQHLENDLAYHDSLDHHFFVSTRIWIDADMANHVFETLKTQAVTLISNERIRNSLVQLYEDEDLWIKTFETKYVDFIFQASETIFPSRFRDFWHGDYLDAAFSKGAMTPLNFEQLKTDQTYLYYLRTQKNHLGWMIKRPIQDTRAKIIALRQEIRKEIESLKLK